MKHHLLVVAFLFFVSLLQAQTYTFNKIINVTDTFDITIYTDSIPNYEDKTRYTAEYIYDADFYVFKGLDSAKTIIPENGIVVTNTVFDAAENIYKTTLSTDNGSNTFASINSSASTLLSTLFKPLIDNRGEAISLKMLLYPGISETEADTVEYSVNYSVLAEANFSIQKRICQNDILTIDIFVDSVPNFANKIFCDFTCYYDSLYFEFIQVDSSKTIIPNGVITVEDECDNDVNSIKELFVETDGLLTPLIEFKPNAKTIFSIQFKMLQPGIDAFMLGNFCFYPSESAPGSTGLDCFTYSSYMQIDSVPDVGIEIGKDNNKTNTLIKTVPQNFTSYAWDYLGETYTSPEISFVEQGLCSVTATTDNGCKSSNSRVVDVPGEYIVPGELKLCAGDTLYIPVFTDSIAYYEYVNSYSFEYNYAVDSFEYIGIDSSHTIIPDNGLNISFNTSGNGVNEIQIAADNGDATFYNIDNNADSLITLMFNAKQGFEGKSMSNLLVKTSLEYVVEEQYSLQTMLNIYNSPMEISEPERTSDYLTVSATKGYKDYVWLYEETSDSDYAFDDFSYSDSTAYFIGNGMYSVFATDGYGCVLRAEEHVEHSGVFAKGNVTANQESFSDGLVAAYLKTGDNFNLVEQTSIINGSYLFPATLNRGYYAFCAIPNEGNSYLSTYYSKVISVEDAFVVNLFDNDGVVGLDIDLLPKSATHSKHIENNNGIEIYPNPVQDILHLRFYGLNEYDGITPIQIVNVMGEVVIQQEYVFYPGFDKLTIDVHNLPKGVYFITIGENTNTFLKR